MTRTTMAALAACSLLTLVACNKQNGTAGSGSLAGTWKADLSSVQIDSKPDVYLVKDGKYTCSSCTPAVTIAADGAFHPITGPYSDALSAKTPDDHSLVLATQKGGKPVSDTTMKVSDDGNTLTIDWKDGSTPNAAPTTGEVTETRVAAAPAGANKVSGSWKPNKINNISEDALKRTYAIDGDTVTMHSAGQSYTAKIGGPAVPLQGDTGGTTVSVDKPSENAIRETFHRGGKVVSVATSTLGADGTLAVVVEDKEAGGTTKLTSRKA